MMDNRTIARWLTDYAHYLEGRRENLFRIRAYRARPRRCWALPTRRL